MNKKAQGGPIWFMFTVILFIVIWFVWLGGFIGDIGESIVEQNNYTGLEAFFYMNMNIFIFIVVILAVLSYGFFTGG